MLRHCTIIVLFTLVIHTAIFSDTEASTTDTGHALQVIRLGVITLYHPLVMYRNYQPFVDYLSKTTPYKFELKISQDYVSIIRFLCDGVVDVALLGGQTYLEASKANCARPLLATLRDDNEPVCQGIFIAREDNNAINEIQDIKGKRFAFASEHSTSGNLAPLYHLYTKENIRLEDFSEYKNLRYHDSVAREVLRGDFDAGVVLDSVARKYQGMGIKFIGQTDPLPGFLLVVRPDLDPELIRSLEDSLLGLDYDNPEDRAIMNQWDVNIRYGFSRVTDSDYDPIRKMVSYMLKKGVQLGVKHEIFPGRSR
ncbi:ABC transporter substrate-binding protein [Desulfolithobacter dissulfuricans]|uniref:ABC transporter substrate-binding protein n=1 Tax=Desulfolithobacter dissulfuricans TaxID=2795293 RepID=A0A915TZD7_9BACT|nr:phosphate/phosphite/phosphonate ABC transporter substrate-binding protein [Desulfolithobacter dissulfuricans]BCO08040.1 ABC transporter substrate-binding protein [Desulfolithobacter dissulfuricans]